MRGVLERRLSKGGRGRRRDRTDSKQGGNASLKGAQGGGMEKTTELQRLEKRRRGATRRGEIALKNSSNWGILWFGRPDICMVDLSFNLRLKRKRKLAGKTQKGLHRATLQKKTKRET